LDSAHWIDLRSDTVTRPTPGMRRAISEAEVGDDVYGEDPTVKRLEATLAERLGMDSGLFLPTGTQSNLVALLTHCGRGDEYIVGQQAHTYKYEGGGAAVLGGIQPQPMDFNEFGGLNLDKVEAYIKPLNDHFARTRLLCLENTIQGKVLPIQYLQDAHCLATKYGLGLHLDGARIFNAAVAIGLDASNITRYFTSVSVCLSKGLGAPAGSVLLGSVEFVKEARRWRKVTGGGMRQTGILAAAGLYALDNNICRLAHDHANARMLAEGLSALGYEVEPVQTNMVFVNLGNTDPDSMAQDLKRYRVQITPARRLRLVTHLDISESDIGVVITGFAECRSCPV
jgi:threonine aldolase